MSSSSSTTRARWPGCTGYLPRRVGWCPTLPNARFGRPAFARGARPIVGCPPVATRDSVATSVVRGRVPGKAFTHDQQRRPGRRLACRRATARSGASAPSTASASSTAARATASTGSPGWPARSSACRSRRSRCSTTTGPSSRAPRASASCASCPATRPFCARTTDQDRTLVIEDASLDPRFADLDVVVRDHVRFYAGEPLRDPMGNVRRHLLPLRHRAAHPRRRGARHLPRPRGLGPAGAALGPRDGPGRPGAGADAALARGLRHGPWHVDGICLPALAVGGDFYDYGVTSDVLHLGLGDVMGKGTGAALVGAGVRSAIRGTHGAVTAGVDLGIVATQVARGLMSDLERAESFVTLFEAAIDLDDGTIRYVDAGMGLCLVVRADGTVEQLVERRPALRDPARRPLDRARDRARPGRPDAAVQRRPARPARRPRRRGSDRSGHGRAHLDEPRRPAGRHLRPGRPAHGAWTTSRPSRSSATPRSRPHRDRPPVRRSG